MVGVNWKMFKERKNQAFRIAGCPVSVAEQVLMLVNIGKLKNPYLDPSQVISFNHAYFSSKIRTAFKRMSGNPYQIKGEAKRGEARPEQNLPPQDSAAE